MISQVSILSSFICRAVLTNISIDGGWLKSHPIPSDKGSFGNFEALAQQNQRLIQQILSEDSSSVYTSAAFIDDHEDPYDTLLLDKLRALYGSCMNEDLLDARGTEPLLNIIRHLRSMFNGERPIVSSEDDDDTRYMDSEEWDRIRLTSALASLHSRGQ